MPEGNKTTRLRVVFIAAPWKEGEGLSQPGLLRTWQTRSFHFPIHFCKGDVPGRISGVPLQNKHSPAFFDPRIFPNILPRLFTPW